MRYLNWALPLLIVAICTGCTFGPPYSLETDWPGSGFGRIETRAVAESAPAVYGPDGKPARIPLLIGGVFVPVDSGVLYRTARRVSYQVRADDGTLHIVSSDVDIEQGACISWIGYADGPSRTHWSMGRVQVERSDKCAK